MQTLVNNQISLSPIVNGTIRTTRGAIILRKRISHRMDLIAVISLLSSAAAYGAFTLMHLA